MILKRRFNKKPQQDRFLPIAVFLFLLLTGMPVWSWTDAGHKITAVIAERNLSKTATSRIKAFLPEGGTLASVSNLADELKRQRPETKPWHYIDLPVRENIRVQDLSFYYAVKGIPDANIVSQINREIAELKSASTDSAVKREALIFLVHFMGDLHMPLHCSDDHDKGGNEKKLKDAGPVKNLHLLWDFILEQGPPKKDPGEWGAAIDRKTPDKKKAAWTAGTVEEWAFETYTFSKRTVYRDLVPGPGIVKLPDNYTDKMKPLAEEQLEKSGVRLAAVLERIFGDEKR